jgi:hypothetical protein
VAIKHTKTSTIPDGPDAAQVQPSDWNADHSLPVSPERLLGNSTVASAEVAELSLGTGLVFGAGSLELQLKTVNSESLLGSGDIVIEGGSGLTYFEESRNTTSPNATVPVHALTALGAETDIDFVVSPKGTGSFSLQVPDGTAAGGNKRGAGAVDFQTLRSSAVQVASGNRAVAAGAYNSVTGAYGFSAGLFNVVTGSGGAVALGSNNEAQAPKAVAIGDGAIAGGDTSFCTGRRTSVRGVKGATAEGWSEGYGALTQMARIPYSRDTSGATPTQLSVGGAALSATTVAIMPNNSAYYCRLRVLARNTSTNESVSWSGTALIKRGANAASTTLIGSSLTSDFGDAAMSACTVTLSADTTRGALAVIVTGLEGATVRWVAQLETVEAA